MKVYRGPKYVEDLSLTDKINLNSKHPNIKPGDQVITNISIDKTGERQSIAAFELDESDFEIIHDNYLKHLKSTIIEQQERIKELLLKLDVHVKAWTAVSSFKQNLTYIPGKIDEFNTFIEEISREQSIYSPIKFNEKFQVDIIGLSNLIEDDLKKTPEKILKGLYSLFKKHEEEFIEYVESTLDKRYYFYSIEDELENRLSNPKTIEIIFKSKKKRLELINSVDLLNLIVQQMLKEDTFQKGGY